MSLTSVIGDSSLSHSVIDLVNALDNSTGVFAGQSDRFLFCPIVSRDGAICRMSDLNVVNNVTGSITGSSRLLIALVLA
jgi:hypothetical protein